MEASNKLEICGAITKGSGEPCRRKPSKDSPSGRCKLHGGMTTVGRPLIHGRYADVTRGQLQQKLREYRQDEPQMITLDEEISLLRSLLELYLETLSGTPSKEETQYIRNFVEDISRTKHRQMKIEAQSAFGPRELKLLQVVLIDVSQRFIGPQSAAFWEEVGARLGSKGLLPEPQKPIEKPPTPRGRG